jgi:hypothetical protein
VKDGEKEEPLIWHISGVLIQVMISWLQLRAICSLHKTTMSGVIPCSFHIFLTAFLGQEIYWTHVVDLLD